MSSFAANHVQSIISGSHLSLPNEEKRVEDSKQTQSPESEHLYSLLVNLKDPLDNERRSTYAGSFIGGFFFIHH